MPNIDPAMLIFPRNFDKGRLKMEDATGYEFTPEDSVIIGQYLMFLKGKVYVPVTVMYRWLGELFEKLPHIDRTVLYRMAGEAMGYHGWRPMLHRKCTYEFNQNRRHKQYRDKKLRRTQAEQV
jgi:hypothetical protein